MKFYYFSWCCAVVAAVIFPRCGSENLPDLDNVNGDIWSYEETSDDQWAQQALKSICDQFHLITKNGKISCDDITLSAKLLSQDVSFEDHNIVRRQTNEGEFEGSGEPDETANTNSPLAIEDTKNVELVTKLPEPAQSPTTPKIIDDVAPPVQTLQKSNEQSVSNASEVFNESVIQQETTLSSDPKEEENITETQTEALAEAGTDENENKMEEIESTTKNGAGPVWQLNHTSDIFEDKLKQEAARTPNENKTEFEVVEKEFNKEDEIKSKIEVVEEAAPVSEDMEQFNKSKLEEKVKQEVEVTSSKNQKELEETKKEFDKEVQNETDSGVSDTKEKEKIDEQQDNNTEILLKQPYGEVGVKGIETSETDKILAHMEVSAETAENNVGQSSKDVTKASKDTTILIVLFVVVIVIGGAAFTYNKVKESRKKRSNSQLNEKSDVEQGTELKPLMKNGANDQKLVTSESIKQEKVKEKS